MCIIIYKPVGVALPEMDILENCYNNNPDGAGLMIRTSGGVVIDKGYFKFNEFVNALNSYDNLKNNAVGIHFRITTHGATNALNCHPFAIKNQLKKIRKTKQVATAGVMHNGVLNSVCVKSNSGLSDTVVYTRDILYKLQQLSGGALTTSSNAQDVINATRGTSRLLLFDNAGVDMFGEFIEDGGVYYSNDSYKMRYINAWDTGAHTNITSLQYKACNECLFSNECMLDGCYCLNEEQAQSESLDSWEYYGYTV